LHRLHGWGIPYEVDTLRRSRYAYRSYLKTRRPSRLLLTKPIHIQAFQEATQFVAYTLFPKGDMTTRCGAASPLLDCDCVKIQRDQLGKPDSSPQKASNKSLSTISGLRSDSISEGRFDGVVRERLNDEASWIPTALSRRSLLAFITTYAILIVVLAVLFSYSNQYNGLASSDEKFHYLWTYGPTAGSILGQQVYGNC
jgi:hypothetical protein